jgi:hydrogenase maturation protease
VGWVVIEQLAELKLPNVDLQTAHQLEVELAETLLDYDAVIFVDAAIPEAPLPLQRSMVTPEFKSHAVAHYLTPPDVLSLCKTLYNREIPGVLFSIRGKDFNFGNTLTEEVQQLAQETVRQIAELVRNDEFRIV